METATAHISRRCRRLAASAVPVVITTAVTLTAPLATTASSSAKAAPAAKRAKVSLTRPTLTASIRIFYRSHTGARRAAMVLLPRSYRSGDQPIPLVISPHGRGISYKTNAHRWGNLPGIGGFAVVSPGGQGDHLRNYSWGATGQVDDLARMPDIVTSKVPGLEVDRSRIYAFGGSMGGQETLLLAARHPSLLAGAAALDSLVDFPRQYHNFPRLGCTPACERMWRGPIGLAMQRLAKKEVGGTPRTAYGKYVTRSPLAYVRELAASCLPLQIWWSRYDRVVIDSSKQSGALFERIKTANPNAPISGYVGPWQHARPFAADRLLPHALAKFGLLPTSYEQPLRRTHFIPPPTDSCTR